MNREDVKKHFNIPPEILEEYHCELCGSVTLICLQKHCIVSKALKNQRFCLQKFEESGIILV